MCNACTRIKTRGPRHVLHRHITDQQSFFPFSAYPPLLVLQQLLSCRKHDSASQLAAEHSGIVRRHTWMRWPGPR